MKQKFFLLSIMGAFLMTGCYKQAPIAKIPMEQICKSPIATIDLQSLKVGEFNDLKLQKNEVQKEIIASLKSSNCFEFGVDYGREYKLDAVFGSIYKHNQQGGFFKQNHQQKAIIEVQFSLSRYKENLIFSGKTTLDLTNNKILGLGETPSFTPLNLNTSLQNSINAALKDLIQNL
ncbi:hypothetical protein B6S12_00805 [Helicobacter valdiviensis]|uniref:Lipoprotein n=1 Tax=Helicobacter valdiviensis TaxID=1458358 RepID=A0A2W6MXB1_9HELI|nr:hypothetical protein [Helicobacter valdiviensis]PZT49165.1 hypothetical protein B6S12_00805 [Helicobacter valdiviensis]